MTTGRKGGDPVIITISSLVFLLVIPFACTSSLPDDVALAYSQLDAVVDFSTQVKPILSDKCFQCHGPDKAKRKAGLRLDIAEVAYSELPNNPGKHAIVPGNLSRSELFHRIISEDKEYMMPVPESNLKLTAPEKATLIKWIEQQAEYKPHWAFTKPSPVVLPKDGNPGRISIGWVHNPIDRFILKKLKEKNLEPSEQAPRDLLLRRLSLDLTGLPPTTEEIQNFLDDDDDDAYEKQVDRLLASPHYGEKMAIDWMDLARYADTHGYQVDRYRNMSPWRDWVINTFNENLPYDQFITWQLAGDLLPNATREQILATGFNRLHPQNLEGGIVDEEFRVAYVSDRTDVLGQGLMGLTVGCAKCHDHKFDPLSQKNYYQLYSFFNNVNESGQISWNSATPVPSLLLPTNEQQEILKYLDQQARKQEAEVLQVSVEAKPVFEQWLTSEGYKNLINQSYPDGMIAHFELENSELENSINPGQKAKMDRQFSAEEIPLFADGFEGKGILLDGDAWIDLGKVGVFKRSQPFTTGLNIYIPQGLKTGVLFHKGIGARLYNFRGYHLTLKDNKLELMMAHTWPDNAIVEYSMEEIPKDQWLQLTLTYDGSSTANGYKIYMNGRELATNVENDNLYKDIIFKNMEGINEAEVEPGLQIGARWRGKGLGGAVVDNIIVYNRELSPLEVSQLSGQQQFKNIISTSPSRLGEEDKELLEGYFLNNYWTGYRRAINELTHIRNQYTDSMERIQDVMVMKEMPQRRKAFILERGQYDTYGEEVFPNTPENILPMPQNLPKNRLGLAKWITHPDHPLTARVAVNRYWQNYFGKGLVRTTEDFGNQGELPSHPELLDWLALHFLETGWDIKALQKLIVMSAVYRQNSIPSDELREIDPENIWLARGPTVRLSSEMIRDNALFASGLINKKIGGESVRPYQPEGLWKTNNDTYIQDSGDNLYRRSLYVIWKRTVPHPTLATFDQPERSECTVRRQKTNTPLQALVLLNDPAYIEAARALGESITESKNTEEGIEITFLKLTGRKPNRQELNVLLKLQQHEYQSFQSDITKVKGWLESGQYRVDTSLDPSLVAANSVVASTIINCDAAITKR